MIVNAINSTTFSGKIKTTKNGNEYEKSNEGKKFVPLVGLTGLAVSTGAGLVTFKKDELFKKMLEETKQNDFEREVFDTFKTSLRANKKVLVLGGAAGLVAIAAVSIGIGAIFDAMINKTRRKDADKFAETGSIDQSANKGKKIGAGIGLAIGSLSLANILRSENIAKLKNIAKDIPTEAIEKEFKTPKAYKFGIIPYLVAIYTAYGAIYDHGVNKFREKLADKKAEQA